MRCTVTAAFAVGLVAILPAVAVPSDSVEKPSNRLCVQYMAFWSPLVGDWSLTQEEGGATTLQTFRVQYGSSKMAYIGRTLQEDKTKDVIGLMNCLENAWEFMVVVPDGVVLAECTIDLTEHRCLQTGLEIVCRHTWCPYEGSSASATAS